MIAHVERKWKCTRGNVTLDETGKCRKISVLKLLLLLIFLNYLLTPSIFPYFEVCVFIFPPFIAFDNLFF